MSTAATDFEALLRTAVEQAAAQAPQASEDLLRLASEAAQAVSAVTGGTARLDLVPIDIEHDSRPTYQLQLWRVKSEAPAADLGIFRLSQAGYPIHRWSWRGAWESRPEQPDNEHFDVKHLKDNFNWMLSKPDSKLVVLVNHLRQLEAQK